MKVFEKGSKKLLADKEGQTGWANAYNPTKKMKPGEMYLTGTLKFNSREKAEEFMKQLQGAKSEGEDYKYNNGNILDIKQGGRGGK
jgi:hypothetical protein